MSCVLSVISKPRQRGALGSTGLSSHEKNSGCLSNSSLKKSAKINFHRCTKPVTKLYIRNKYTRLDAAKRAPDLSNDSSERKRRVLCRF